MSVFVAIVGLLLLVAVHELGHFTAAKATGMRALRFYLGFPPAVVKRQCGDTEYGIGAIPLGGFVKIPGMLRPEPGDLYDVDDLLDRSENVDDDAATAPRRRAGRRPPPPRRRAATTTPWRRCPPARRGRARRAALSPGERRRVSPARWTGSTRTSTRAPTGAAPAAGG